MCKFLMTFIIFKAAVVPRICSSCLRRRGLVRVLQTQTANDVSLFFFFFSCSSEVLQNAASLLETFGEKGGLFQLFYQLCWNTC